MKSHFIRKYLQHMRIFITSTDDDGTKRTTRIFLDNCNNTSLLLKEIAKEMGVSRNYLIVKLKYEPYNLKIVDNWPLNHYPIRNGSTLIVEFNEKYTCRELRLSTEPLGSVQQEGDFDLDEEESRVSYLSDKEQHTSSKYLEECLKQMLEAVRNGNLDRIAQILREQPKIEDEDDLSSAMEQRYQHLLNQVGDCGRNVLHEAIQVNNADIVSFLLIKGTDPSLPTFDDHTPLQLAVLNHSPDVLTLLLQQSRIDVNQVTTHGTALHMAAAHEDVKCIEILFQNDANTETVDNQGRRAIEVTHNQTIKKLLQKKAEIRKGKIPNISKGNIFKVTNLTYRLKQRSLLINPFKNQFTIQHLSKEEEEKFQIDLIAGVDQVEERSWLMSGSMSYFKVSLKDKDKTELLFGVKNQKILEKWIENFKAAAKYRENFNFTKPVPSSQQLIELINDDANTVTLHKRRIDNQFTKKNMSILNMLPDEEPSLVNRIKSRLSMRKSDRRFVNFSEEYVMDESQIVIGSIIKGMEGSIIRGLQSTQSQKGGSEYASIVESTMEPSFLDRQFSKNQFRKNSMNRSQYTVSEFKSQDARFNISFRDFQIIKLLGTGSFGQVFQVRCKKDGKTYALKVLSKQKLIKKKQLKYAVGQASILKKLDFPFVIALHFSFQTPQNLYLALDHCPRGDLAELITVKEKLDESTARFIIAQVVLALEYLHSRNVLYRDLKPENILIAADGYVRLTDFGLSRQNCFSMSFCGSPAYLSPQMLEKKGVGFSCDIYGIGCILFQMLVGEPPFFDDNLDTLYDNIRSGKLRYPSYLSIEAKSIISKLLERDITKRLGSKNFNDIKAHDFFRKMDWTGLLERRMKPPSEMLLEDPDNFYELELEHAQPLRLSDTDYEASSEKINRIKHFTFVRQSHRQQPAIS